MLWIVGPVAPDFRSYLTDRSIAYGLLADGAKPLPEHAAHVPVVTCDFSSRAALVASVSSPHLKVDALMTSGYEHYVVPAAWLAEHFKVVGTSAESALAATDKSIMRQRFRTFAPETTPDFQVAASWQEAESFATSHPFPLMIKPTNLMKSLFVSKVVDMGELKAHYRTLTDQLVPLQERFHLEQPPRILVEEFLHGSMHTVAGFADADGNFHAAPGITDCLTAHDIGVKDSYLYARLLPSKLDKVQAEAVFAVAAKGVKALGLTSVPLHIELMLTANGPKIIEIGARLGGYRARMYMSGFGIDLHQVAITVAKGGTPNMAPQHTSHQAVIELFPDKTGAFKTIARAAGLKAHQACQNLAIKSIPGERVGPAKQGFLAAATVFVGHDDPSVFEDRLEYIRQRVRVDVA